jgi:hypothetical protein
VEGITIGEVASERQSFRDPLLQAGRVATGTSAPPWQAKVRTGGYRPPGPDQGRQARRVHYARDKGTSARLPAEVGAAERWRTLASEKLVEVNELIAQLGEMRARLKAALRCECSSLGECAELLTDS